MAAARGIYGMVTGIDASALALVARPPIRTGMPNPARLFLLSLLCLGSLPAAPQPWTRLKVGMSAIETVSLLGHPIFHRQGHGFVTWTYDHGAEVLLQGDGAVVGWTAPASAGNPARSQDIWSNQPAGQYHATMHAVLPRLQKPGAKRRPGLVGAAGGTTYEQLIRG